MTKRNPIFPALVTLVLLAGAALTWRHFHDPLIGAWAATDRNADGATQTTTYTFLKDGLATMEVKTDKGSLLTVNAGGLGGGAAGGDAHTPGGANANPLAALFGALLPTVRRAHVKSTWSVKGDVVTLRVTDVNLFDDHDQPVSLSNETHKDTQTFRYKVGGETLTIDKLDGTPPTRLTRRAD